MAGHDTAGVGLIERKLYYVPHRTAMGTHNPLGLAHLVAIPSPTAQLVVRPHDGV
jgi:hypothetical protein